MSAHLLKFKVDNNEFQDSAVVNLIGAPHHRHLQQQVNSKRNCQEWEIRTHGQHGWTVLVLDITYIAKGKISNFENFAIETWSSQAVVNPEHQSESTYHTHVQIKLPSNLNLNSVLNSNTLGDETDVGNGFSGAVSGLWELLFRQHIVSKTHTSTIDTDVDASRDMNLPCIAYLIFEKGSTWRLISSSGLCKLWPGLSLHIFGLILQNYNCRAGLIKTMLTEEIEAAAQLALMLNIDSLQEAFIFISISWLFCNFLFLLRELAF